MKISHERGGLRVSVIGLALALTAAIALPDAAEAAETVYDCTFTPGASPLSRTTIHYDEASGRMRVSASHFEPDDLARSFNLQRDGSEIEISYEVHGGGTRQRLELYRINSMTGEAEGNVDLYDDNGDYMRGGPLPVEGQCTIAEVRAPAER
ncbi:MAG: hypothetical protein IT566_10765 [Rhodospirillaceae bacterium]|nr:hypothetical protein [Rhodospirillaceae bacterium]